MAQGDPQLLVGVSAGFDSIHAIIVREEADGRWRLMGEYNGCDIMGHCTLDPIELWVTSSG